MTFFLRNDDWNIGLEVTVADLELQWTIVSVVFCDSYFEIRLKVIEIIFDVRIGDLADMWTFLVDFLVAKKLEILLRMV